MKLKLNYRRTLLIGLAFFSISVFWQMYDHIIPLILKYTFGVPEVASGVVMAMDNVLALFLLPVFGSLSDRTNTRFGRRMPFIVVGTVGAALFMLLIPYADRIGSMPLFIVGLGLTLLSMSLYRSPAVALMPDLTLSPLRSKGNAIINLTGVVGSLTILGLTGLLLPDEPAADAVGNIIYHPNYFPMFLCCIVIMVVSVTVLVATIREVKLFAEVEAQSKALGLVGEPAEAAPEGGEKKEKGFSRGERRSFMFLMMSIAFWFMGYNAITTNFSKYCLQVFGMGAGTSAQVLMVAQVAAILTFIPSGMMATRFGRKRVIQCGVVLLALAFGSAAFFSTFTPLIFVCFAMAGIAWAGINVNSLPMVVEFAGLDQMGRYTGFYYTASMSAQIVTPILSGAFLELHYRTLMPYGTLFVALSFVTMLFVKHGDARPVKNKAGVEAFEALDN